MSAKKGSVWLIIIACTGLVLALFSGKALHIDDPLFIWAAQQIQQHPFDFYGFSINWFGTTESAVRCIKNPPFASYYAALVMQVFGENGIALHLAFIVPAMMAMAGTYQLAKRWCALPELALIIATVSPLFMVSATTLMCDMFMVGFFIWAIEFWIKGIKADKKKFLLLSSLFICLSAFSKYFGICSIPLLFVYTILVKRRVGWWIVYLLAVGAVLCGYDTVTAKMYGIGLFTNAVSYKQNIAPLLSGSVQTKGVVTLLFVGGCLANTLLYMPMLMSRKWLGVILASMVACVCAMHTPGLWSQLSPVNPDHTLLVFFQAGIFITGALACIGVTLADVYKRRDAVSILLLLWVLGTLIFTALFNWTVNARSILPLAPALGIIIARRIEDNSNKKKLRWQWVALIAAACLTLLVMWADFALANSARATANKIAHDYTTPGRTIWFEGHWGFQYYMQKNGGTSLELFRGDQVKSGDIIILACNNSNVYNLPESFAQEIKSIRSRPCSFLSTMQMDGHTGFYANVWGPLPYLFGSAPEEIYTVNVVR